jgi:hypothetical protein
MVSASWGMGFRQWVEPQFVERLAGQVHPAGAAHFFFTVHMVDVIAGVFVMRGEPA